MDREAAGQRRSGFQPRVVWRPGDTRDGAYQSETCGAGSDAQKPRALTQPNIWQDMGVVDLVSIAKLKRPVGSARWGAYTLTRDEFGTWLYTPAGSIYQGEDGQSTGVCEVAQDGHGVGRSIVQLIPPVEWWIATWYPPTADRDVTIDICTPAVLALASWKYTDMELDPWRSRGGAVCTDDWHEFRAACAAGWITNEEAENCLAATESVEASLRQRTEPFDQVGKARLAVAMALLLPPRD